MQDPNPLMGKMRDVHAKLINPHNDIPNKLRYDVQFLEQCKIIVEHGWQPHFNHQEDLALFKPTNDPVNNYLTRLYLFKLISEACLENRDHKSNDGFFSRTKKKLDTDFEELIKTAQFSRTLLMCTTYEPLAVFIILNAIKFYLQWSEKNPTTYDLLLTKILIPAFTVAYAVLTTLRQIRSASAVGRDHFFPQAREFRELPNIAEDLRALMNNESFKAQFVVNNNDIAKLESSGPQPH